MKIALPVENDKLCSHFGHCESFAIFEVEENKIARRSIEAAPSHEPGLLPRWLSEKGVTVVIAGGMGGRAQDLFLQRNIKVVVGASSDSPEMIVNQFLENELKTADNACTHGEGHMCGG